MRARPAHLFLALAAALAAAPIAGLAADGASPDSPFSAGGAPAPEAGLRLSGISVIGGRTYVSIIDGQDALARWLAVGSRLGDIEVVSCDVDASRCVVRVAGRTRVLDLPKPEVAAGGPPAAAGAAPGPSPAGTATAVASAPIEPISPELAAEEREARMLVTDLLEISQQQRQAYAEAQRAAAAAATPGS